MIAVPDALLVADSVPQVAPVQPAPVLKAAVPAPGMVQVDLTGTVIDTGAVTVAATYRFADETYAKLLDKTSGEPIPEVLRQDLLSYYADLNKPFATGSYVIAAGEASGNSGPGPFPGDATTTSEVTRRAREGRGRCMAPENT